MIVVYWARNNKCTNRPSRVRDRWCRWRFAHHTESDLSPSNQRTGTFRLWKPQWKTPSLFWSERYNEVGWGSWGFYDRMDVTDNTSFRSVVTLWPILGAEIFVCARFEAVLHWYHHHHRRSIKITTTAEISRIPTVQATVVPASKLLSVASRALYAASRCA